MASVTERWNQFSHPATHRKEDLCLVLIVGGWGGVITDDSILGALGYVPIGYIALRILRRVAR